MTEVIEQIKVKEIKQGKEKRNVPRLRFRGFEDEWIEKRISDFLDFYTTNSLSRENLTYEKGEIKNIHYGDIHMKFPVMLDVEKNSIPFINDLVDASKFKCESFCRKGDIIIADASENYEDIGKVVEIVNMGNSKVVAGLHTILGRDNTGTTSVGFKGYMFQSNNVRKQIKVLAAGAKVLGISKSNLSSIRVNIPILQEQKKIADFFSLVDKKIEKQSEKVEALKTYQKGIMQKIFKQEIRFKDENGEEYPEWEEKRLGDIGLFTSGVGFNEKYQGNINLKYKFFKVSDMNIPQNKKIMLVSNNTVSENMLKELKGKLIINDSIIFAKVGAAIFLERKRIALKNFLIDNNMMAFTPEESNSLIFYYYVFNNIKLSKYAQIGALPSYNSSDLKCIKIKIPCIQEQMKTANFLSTIDEKMDKEEKKLEELKVWKKGLLQKMFV